ncbi:glycoside hydrolase domain-containing protein [Virgibacillus soli]
MIGFATVIFTLFIVIIFDQHEVSKDPPVTEKDDGKDNDNNKDSEQQNDKDKDENKSNDKGKDKDKSQDKGKKDKNKEEQKVHWGVDSAEVANDELLACVVEHFGKPKVFGRYLGDNEGVSTGLTKEEVEFLHDENVKILVIYNHVSDVTGKKQGIDHAKQAIKLAKELGIPEGVAIFADIEPDYPVNTAFLEGWYETLADSPYEPAIYGVFDKDSELLAAFQNMQEDIQKEYLIWTAHPQEKITSKENAPKFDPQGPEKAKVFGWQYAIEAKKCTIDTNLFQDELLDFLW